jgi:hypothetical protein
MEISGGPEGAIGYEPKRVWVMGGQVHARSGGRHTCRNVFAILDLSPGEALKPRQRSQSKKVE